ncbi:type II secretion system F family protein [Alkalibacillus almallahensis]|uniref:type II secretion system F family protein n=1 Tax=Alkalibacillus almallahensis TaxID=1379154 RepID=UPI0014243652|nr:type II secretion system F family protein [Alkalibacillus almallahensis]
MVLSKMIHRQTSSISLKDQVDFLNRLAKLLKHSFTLRQSLQFMMYDPKFNYLANEFVIRLQQGQSIDSCFRELKFHPIVNAFLYFSTSSGHMSYHLIQCYNLLKMRVDFQKKLKDITKYPLILLILSLVIFFCMSLFLLPVYNNTLNSIAQGASYIWFNLFVSIVQVVILAGIPLLLLTLFIIVIIYKKQSIEQQITTLDKIPLVRNVIRLSTTAQFAFHLGAIISNGKTVKSGLLIMSQQSDLTILEYYAKSILVDLKLGRTLTQSTNNLELIETDFKLMLKHSVEQGSLAEDLQAYAAIALSSLEERLQKLMMTIQPIMYSLLGIMIVIIYVLTLFPMFQLINHI